MTVNSKKKKRIFILFTGNPTHMRILMEKHKNQRNESATVRDETG